MSKPHEHFTIPPLPYEFGGLEPFIGESTMFVHHGKMLSSCVSKLNQLMDIHGDKYIKHGKPIGLLDLVLSAPEDSELYQNAAQVWSHDFFFNSLKPYDRDNCRPGYVLLDKIVRDFGSLKDMKKLFNEKACSHFGSAYVFLLERDDGTLCIECCHDANNPIRLGLGNPLICCDIWEHAWIESKTSVESYLEKFWSVVNWGFAEKNLLKEFRD